MVTERQTQETVARCVSLLVLYQKVEKTEAAKVMLAAEVEVIADQIAELGLDVEAQDQRIFQPLLAQLQVRYTSNVATILYDQFLSTFRALGRNSRQSIVHRG